jgi:NAD(P)-dependent dehydrogenase (short-subunit alcohol dehydrogenase family)
MQTHPALVPATEREIEEVCEANNNYINSSSTVGSITLGPVFSMNSAHAYKISKAAMNMLTMQYAVDYKDEGFTAFALSPGVCFPLEFPLLAPHCQATSLPHS